VVDAVVYEVVVAIVNDTVVVDGIVHKVASAIIGEASCRCICQRMQDVHLVDEVALACQ
jgi:hypothetical protein